jgi:hypothetical protein
MVASKGTDRVALELMVEEIKSHVPEEPPVVGWTLGTDRRKDKMIWGILNFLDDDNDVRVDVRCFDTSDHGQVTKTDAALG